MPFKFDPVLVQPDQDKVERYNQAVTRFNNLLDEVESASNGPTARFAGQARTVIEDAKDELVKIKSKVIEPYELSAANNEAVAAMEKRINDALDVASEFINTESLM